MPYDMSKPVSVCVVMSTYNGENYVEEQIDSILTQKSVKVDLYIRDDGSKDKTVAVIEAIAKKHTNVHIAKGENIGYARSFLSLLKSISGFDYYAFADQDDVWMPDKLFEATNMLHLKGNPAKDCLCYWCNLELVDAALTTIDNMVAAKESDFIKERYLIDKYGYGCTMVFSSALKERATKTLPAPNITHDNWVGLTSVFLGIPIYDSRIFIKYRQHANNVVGGNNSLAGTWKRRLKNLNKIKSFSRAEVAEELIRCYSDELQQKDMELLNMVANYKDNFHNKLVFFFDKSTKRASFEKNMLFRIEILLSLA